MNCIYCLLCELNDSSLAEPSRNKHIVEELTLDNNKTTPDEAKISLHQRKIRKNFTDTSYSNVENVLGDIRIDIPISCLLSSLGGLSISTITLAIPSMHGNDLPHIPSLPYTSR